MQWRTKGLPRNARLNSIEGRTGIEDDRQNSGEPNLNLRRPGHDDTQYRATGNTPPIFTGQSIDIFLALKSKEQNQELVRCQDGVEKDSREDKLHWYNVQITGSVGQLTRHQRSSFALPALPIDASISGGHGSRKSLNSRTRGEDIVKTVQSVCELSRLMILNG